MTAAWKQKKFERLAQKDLVEDLKSQVALLYEKLAAQQENRKYMEDRMKLVYDQRDQAMILANRYNMLRTQELMIATPDGFKLVTGEELDIHCGGIQDRESPKVKGWPMSYTVSADQSIASWWSEKQSAAFSEQLAKSMVRTRETMKEGIEIYGNTRSTSQEEDTKDT
jgi:hypothetical protein